MTSGQEKTLMYRLATEHYQGVGHILEAGLFLGASTLAFGSGILAHRHVGLRLGPPRIESYDMFKADDIMANRVQKYYPGANISKGESFKFWYDLNVRSVANLSSMQVGDFAASLQEHTGIQPPLEIVFLDVLKIEQLIAPVARHVFPRMMPGHTVVLHQDWIHEYLPWIHWSMGFLDEYFEYIASVDHSTVAFLYTKRIPMAILEELQTLHEAHIARKLELFDRGVSLASPLSWRHRMTVGLARVLLIKMSLKGVPAAQAASWRRLGCAGLAQSLQSYKNSTGLEPPGNHCSKKLYEDLRNECARLD